MYSVTLLCDYLMYGGVLTIATLSVKWMIQTAKSRSGLKIFTSSEIESMATGEFDVNWSVNMEIQ
ncbi:hypothetical protein FHS16_000824 [Paenibacillus endophyticus]|uniref:Uncharacterized protein n=1 Tax=Paenibacillus endophyticus TaxID=1294268 RepID=A0A7W5G8L4_9BACL|nr:hypothetical protein [Paenibacillus endophyticus]